ncbi:alpha/beta fold hydrolase [Guptibacillus algicola]|uniref:alpha/beta fold hydrolase n=1 Tax=Guptibacillus algicola TaxID=225844 RepID=UPI001CD65D0E|nr:alpha/beta hydrolase [Alkalihalobacillus algicola]MCA0987449.1 alpha/beta hydrolase [Alkalihalobacillus algicola]
MSVEAAEGKWIEVNGRSLYVYIIGEGDPIIFLHGGPGGCHEYFLPNMTPLADYYQLVFYDQSGCGSSPSKGIESYSIQDEVRNLEGLRKALGLDKIHLFGESWGSILALYYSASYPSAINKLILTAAIGLTAEDYKRFKDTLLKRLGVYKKMTLGWYSLLAMIGNDTTRKVTNLLDPYYVHSVQSLRKKKEFQYNKVAMQQIGSELERSYDLFPLLHAIEDVPMLIAQGCADVLSPESIRTHMMPHLCNAVLVEVKESGHWTVLEQPERVIEHTIDFLENKRFKVN